MASCFTHIFNIVSTNTFFCELVRRGFDGTTLPSKYFSIVATPELIHSNDGSSCGIKDALGSTVCPCCLKKF